MSMAATLASLLPTQRLAVMDLVEQAGIDVTKWQTTAGSVRNFHRGLNFSV